MNKHKHCYVFADNEKATRFYTAATAEGFAAEAVNNAVFTDERVYAYIKEHFYLESDEEPVWMSDHE